MEKELKYVLKSNEFDGYSIDDNGEVYSCKSGKKISLKKTYHKNRGYVVYLGKKSFSVQLLLAKAFIPNIENKNLVKHIDGNHKNNKLDNLIWTTELDLYKARVDTALKLMPKSNNYEKRINEISGYEKIVGYTVDINGNVYSYLDGDKKILKPSINKGYRQVMLGSRLNKKITRKVHRLVGEAFITKCKNKPQINHKDGNKANNHISNLEWVNNKENQRHAILNDLKNTRKINMYDLNHNLIKTFNSMFEVKDYLNIKYTFAIEQCINKIYSQAYGYIWSYND